MSDAEEITHEAALMWLNGLRNRIVMVDVVVDCGDHFDAVLSASGTLRHWRDTDPEVAQLDRSGLREDIRGLYSVEGLGIDISNADIPCEFRIEHLEAGDEPGELVVDRLAIDAGNVVFRVSEVRGADEDGGET